MKNIIKIILCALMVSSSFELLAEKSVYNNIVKSHTKGGIVVPPGCDPDPSQVTVNSGITLNKSCGSTQINITSVSNQAGYIVTAFDSQDNQYLDGDIIYSTVYLALWLHKPSDPTCKEVVSGTTINVVVDQAPTLSLSAPDPFLLCIEDDFIISAVTTNAGSSPTYKWYKKAPSSSTYTLISGENGSTFDAKTLAPDMDGIDIKCKLIVNNGGCSTEQVSAWQRYVIPPKWVDVSIHQPSDYCPGVTPDKITVTSNANGDFFTAYWIRLYEGSTLLETKSGNVDAPLNVTFSQYYEGDYTVKIEPKSGSSSCATHSVNVSFSELTPTVGVVFNDDRQQLMCPSEHVTIRTNNAAMKLYDTQQNLITSGVTYQEVVDGTGYHDVIVVDASLLIGTTRQYKVKLSSGVCLQNATFTDILLKQPTIASGNPKFIDLDASETILKCDQSGVTKAVTLSVDPTQEYLTIVDPNGDFTDPLDVKFDWVGIQNDTESIIENLEVGSHNYTVDVYSAACPNVKSTETFTVNMTPEYEKPDPPVLENNTVCFSGELELQTSGFDSYVWIKDNQAQSNTTDNYKSPLIAANTGDYKVQGIYYEDTQAGIVCKTNDSNIKTVALYGAGECDDYLNYVTAISFDQDGIAHVAESKSYFDLAGEALQSQSIVFDANDQKQVIATQTIKDVYGRDVIQTLAAPINRTDFLYNHNFVTTDESGTEVRYTSAHFDGSASAKTSPQPLENSTPGTLGWYYSANNTLEENVPQTSYPYTRTDFYEDGSGEVKRSAAPGDELRMGKNHESITKTLPVGDKSVELKHYDALRDLVLGLSTPQTIDKVYKQIAIDPDGKEVVSFQTEEGTIATAIVEGTGTSVAYDAYDDRLEIHVPKNVANSTVTLTGRTAEFKVLDKIADENDITASLATGSTISLAPGIYSLSGLTSAEYSPNYAEYSYNIYDNAGRLAASIAPLGVEDILTNGVPASRNALTYTTYYSYDFLGRLVEMDEPDAGLTKYLYRKDGSIRFSENELQRDSSHYSYTCYDEMGRPVESGEYIGSLTYSTRNTSAILEAIGSSGFADSTERQDWVETHYDFAYQNGSDLLQVELQVYMDDWYEERYGSGHGFNTLAFANNYVQDFLEGAVSYTENENVTTWYSYDEFGQVTFIVMKYKNMNGGQYYTIDYQYDYYGNVIEVAYQKHFAGESFYHHYEYNKNQQLTKVYTSQAGLSDPNIYLHATYHYYLHGPLKRVELAENLQGLDYTYTAQGWLKAINSPATNYDPGADGSNTFFSDAFGMEIDYYNGDHTSDQFQSVNPDTQADEQFSGNIRSITWGRGGTANDQEFEYLTETLNEALTEDTDIAVRDNILLEEGFDSNGYLMTIGIDPSAVKDIPLEIEAQQYEYTYDFKNQLKEAAYTDVVASSATNDTYAVKGLDYDANGNIQALQRYDEAAAVADNFTYDYNYEEHTNQLDTVSGYAGYRYNAIGQMTASLGRGEFGSQYYNYDVTGKVTAIFSDEAKANQVARYEYDDRGFRILKEDADGNQTWYIRDASGNIIGLYDKPSTASRAELTELPIYGSGKIGTSFRDPLKYKYSYELTDHLGNVRTVVSKLKFYEVATLETEAQLTESAVWENLNTYRQQDQMLNTTNINGNESFSVRLDGSNGVIGPAMSRAVSKGDKIAFRVNAMYIDGFSSSGLASNIFGLVAGAYGVTAGGETQAVYDGLNAAVANAGAFLATPPSGVPKAYIQCLMFDKDFNDITSPDAHAMVSINAAGNATSAENISGEIEMPEDGYIYVYIANETEGALVNFDDLTVSVLGFDVSEMTDYYPFGSIAKHWEKEPYRFGYQGQFAEEDEETGYNHFESREYDGRIGRWLSVDPAREFYSPYVGMGNNVINSVDPNGENTWYLFRSLGWMVGALGLAGDSQKDIYAWDDYGIIKASSISLYNVHDEGEWGIALNGGMDWGFGINDESSYFQTLKYGELAGSGKLIAGFGLALLKEDLGSWASGMEASFGIGAGGGVSFTFDDAVSAIAFTHKEIWDFTDDVVKSFNPYDLGVDRTDGGDFLRLRLTETSEWMTTDIRVYEYQDNIWETEVYKNRREAGSNGE